MDTLTLNPLPPRETLYQTTINDPLPDSQIAVQALASQIQEVARLPQLQLTALHHLTTLRDREELAPSNIPMGRPSSSFKPARPTRPKARVLATARWTKSKSDPAYHDRLRNEAWEIVIPEFIYPPE